MNIATALNKCLEEDSNGNMALKVFSTGGGTEKLEKWQSKLRKSIDTTNYRVRVVA